MGCSRDCALNLSWFQFKFLIWNHHKRVCDPVPLESAEAASNNSSSWWENQAGDSVLRGDFDGKCVTNNSSPQLRGWLFLNTVKNPIPAVVMRSLPEERLKKEGAALPDMSVTLKKKIKKKCSCDFQKTYVHCFLLGLSLCCSQIPELKKCGNLQQFGVYRLSWLTCSVHLKPSVWLEFLLKLFISLPLSPKFSHHMVFLMSDTT